MKNKNWLLAIPLFAGLYTSSVAQELTVTNLTSVANASAAVGISNFEPIPYGYNFIAPLNSSLLCKLGHQGTPPSIPFTDGIFCSNPEQYTPSLSNRYFMAVFGPRMQANDGAINALYDFHRGEDIVDKAIPTTPLPDILCVCDGIVHKVFDEADLPPGTTIEQTEEGRYVTVKCNATFNGNAAMGNIYTAYRHLSEINGALTENSPILRGEVIGKMGNSGITSTIHLHFSAQKMVNNNLINVHPMRLFNPVRNEHLMVPMDYKPQPKVSGKKDRVNIFLLGSSNTSTNPDENWAVFRVAVPFKKANIRAVAIKNGTYNEKVDFEEISEVRDGNVAWLDDPVVGKLRLNVFPFNRGQTAYNRFTSIQAALAAHEHTGNQYPIPNSGIFTTPAYVLDIKAKGLPKNFPLTGFVVHVVDIWGRGVKGNL